MARNEPNQNARLSRDQDSLSDGSNNNNNNWEADTPQQKQPMAQEVLTSEEIGWALAIKKAAQEDPELEKLSDLEYVQYALVTRGDVENALYRIQGMQNFYEEYKIHNTVEEGIDLVTKLMTISQEWLVLDVEYEQEHGHFVLVLDYSKLDPSAVNTPEEWRNFLGGMYYLYTLCQANVESVKEGLVRIVETLGMGWSNFSVDFYRQCWHHFLEFFPMRNKEATWVHASLIGNMQHSFFKSMMKDTANVIRVGVQFEAYDGKLEEIFCQPTKEVAKARLLEKAEGFIRARFYNQEVFQLPDGDIAEMPAERTVATAQGEPVVAANN